MEEILLDNTDQKNPNPSIILMLNPIPNIITCRYVTATTNALLRH